VVPRGDKLSRFTVSTSDNVSTFRSHANLTVAVPVSHDDRAVRSYTLAVVGANMICAGIAGGKSCLIVETEGESIQHALRCGVGAGSTLRIRTVYSAKYFLAARRVQRCGKLLSRLKLLKITCLWSVY